ncbi:MAG: hypothetical protein H0V89_05920 [Deltaproteobacteria bacterium]|nr:hypothetical protein [Deltaproteobacteria bacterium]
MEPIAWHITFDLRGRLPIARTATEWDAFTRLLWRVLEPWKNLGFCLMHDHLHILAAVDRATAGRVAQAIECALGWLRRPKDHPRRSTWNPPRFTAMRDRRHLGTSAAYVMRNGSEATGSDPLVWRWSSAWEAVGLRVPRFDLATGFEVCTPAFAAEVLTGDARWRPPAAPSITSAAEAPATLSRLTAAALGHLDRRAMDRPTRKHHNELTFALGRHRGWAPVELAPTLGLHAKSVSQSASRQPAPSDLDAAKRLLGLHLAGWPAASLLPDVPANPLPAGARKRWIRG